MHVFCFAVNYEQMPLRYKICKHIVFGSINSSILKSRQYVILWESILSSIENILFEFKVKESFRWKQIFSLFYLSAFSSWCIASTSRWLHLSFIKLRFAGQFIQPLKKSSTEIIWKQYKSNSILFSKRQFFNLFLDRLHAIVFPLRCSIFFYIWICVYNALVLNLIIILIDRSKS